MHQRGGRSPPGCRRPPPAGRRGGREVRRRSVDGATMAQVSRWAIVRLAAGSVHRPCCRFRSGTGNDRELAVARRGPCTWQVPAQEVVPVAVAIGERAGLAGAGRSRACTSPMLDSTRVHCPPSSHR
jgi:hypothetical protein